MIEIAARESETYIATDGRQGILVIGRRFGSSEEFSLAVNSDGCERRQMTRHELIRLAVSLDKAH